MVHNWVRPVKNGVIVNLFKFDSVFIKNSEDAKACPTIIPIINNLMSEYETILLDVHNVFANVKKEFAMTPFFMMTGTSA